MRKMLFVLILVQLCLVAYLIIKITIQISPRVLGTKTSINTISSANINTETNKSLKYFYESPPNITATGQPTWLPEPVTYTINSDTLNERFDYSVDKPSDVFRIITLGDSFTYGLHVNTKDNWTELLEDKLNYEYKCKNIKKFEVINLGRGGYDTQYAVERYRIRGQKYNPDLVIWTFFDFERILEKMIPSIEQNDTKENKDLEKKGIYYKNWIIARENLLKEIGKDGVIKYQKEQMLKLDDYYQGKLLFIALPNYSENPNYPEYIDLLKQRVKNRPNSYFFQPTIKYEDKQYFLPDSHFNNEGHKKMTEEIVKVLEKERLLPCN